MLLPRANGGENQAARGRRKHELTGCRHRVLLGEWSAGWNRGGIISTAGSNAALRAAAAPLPLWASPRACLIGFECPHQRRRLMLQGSRPLQQRGRRGGHIRALEPLPEQLVHQVGEPSRSACLPRTSPQVLVANVECYLAWHMDEHYSPIRSAVPCNAPEVRTLSVYCARIAWRPVVAGPDACEN